MMKSRSKIIGYIEQAVMNYLLANAGRLVTTNELSQYIYKDPSGVGEGAKQIRRSIHQLREKGFYTYYVIGWCVPSEQDVPRVVPPLPEGKPRNGQWQRIRPEHVTFARVDNMRQLGMSFNLIAKELGTTKNTVIGVHDRGVKRLARERQNVQQEG